MLHLSQMRSELLCHSLQPVDFSVRYSGVRAIMVDKEVMDFTD